MLLSKRQKNAQNVFKAGFTPSKKYPNVILIHFTKILNFTSIKVTYTIVLVIDFVFWLSKLNIQTDRKRTTRFHTALFICGGPCHLSGIKQCSGELIFFWKQLLYSHMETIISSPKVDSTFCRKIKDYQNGYPYIFSWLYNLLYLRYLL